jgi:glycosidase
MRHYLITFLVWLLLLAPTKAEPMIQYFNTSWAEITQKMPELAEVGYESIWVPPPTKAGSQFSVGYDLFDPYDLGSKDQKGGFATKYGTYTELVDLIETAHRFGIRVYFDNIMNHRGFDTPLFNAQSPKDLYPGLVPEDFHLRTVVTNGLTFYRKWDNTRNWGDEWQVYNLGLSDLIDIAQEPGEWNHNHGPSEGWWTKKPKIVRNADNPEYYCFDAKGNYVGFGPDNGLTKEYILANSNSYSEFVQDYLYRSVRWLTATTYVDGFRLDAVKHARADFFGANYGNDKDFSDYGYTGQIQRQFNITRGYSDANHRDTVFDTEKGRDDAMIFGEHLGEPPPYTPYINAGMRLIDNPLKNTLDGRLGNPSNGLWGLDQPGFGGFSPEVSVTHAQSHDIAWSTHRHLQHAIYFTRVGLPLIYTDGNYHAGVLQGSGGEFPRIANTAFLGQWNDPRIPNLVYIHNHFARGYQKGIWSDADLAVYERIDKRENQSMGDWDGVTGIVMINDNFVAGRGEARVKSSFPSNAFLYQYATGPNGSGQTGFYKYAWELGSVIVPPGGYYFFSWRTPETPSVWGGYSPITILQNGKAVDYIKVSRKDGPNGDPAFNPYGLPDTNTTDFSYDVAIPYVTNGSSLSFIVNADGSAEMVRLKLDGGWDVNSFVGLGPQGGDKRDAPPGLTTDTFLGYEFMQFVHRGKEKFGSIDTRRNVIGSPGAETYIVNRGTNNAIILTTNNGNGMNDSLQTAQFVYHNPTDLYEGTTIRQARPILRSYQVYFKTGYQFDVDRAYVYYTTDLNEFPEGSVGSPKGTTRVVQARWLKSGAPDSTGRRSDWWVANIPYSGGHLKYKISALNTKADSVFPNSPYNVSLKRKMETEFQIANFNANETEYYVHNDYSIKRKGLTEGFHVLRARAYLKRPGQASLYNTFTQVFYYDAKNPEGAVKFPSDNQELTSFDYEFVVHTDHTVKEVLYNIVDSDPLNDDVNVGRNYGNGNKADGTPSWGVIPTVRAINDSGNGMTKEWRFKYINIPASGTGTINLVLRETASPKKEDIKSIAPGKYGLVTKTYSTKAPAQAVGWLWPSSTATTEVRAGWFLNAWVSASFADWQMNRSLLSQRVVIEIENAPEDIRYILYHTRRDGISWFAGWDSHHLRFVLPPTLPKGTYKIYITGTNTTGRKVSATRTIQYNP